MHYEKLLDSDYLKATDLDGKEITVKIGRLSKDLMSDEKKGEREKGVIYFDGKKKGWVLNRTNILCLVAMFGTETDGWLGKRVTLYPEIVTLADKSKGPAIRVKGSPDLGGDIEADIKLPRRKAIKRRLYKTGNGSQGRPPVRAATCDGVHEEPACASANCYLAEPGGEG